MFRMLFGSIVLIILAIIIVTLFQGYFQKIAGKGNLETHRKSKCTCDVPGAENKFKI